MPDKSQYAAVANIPLIKSPSLRAPKPVELPQDIHPLPDSVIPYFVYPFTLEPHVITLESSRRTTVASHAARRAAYLRSRDDEIERRKRDALHKIAPGLGSLLVPTRPAPNNTSGSMHNQIPGEQENERNVMNDLVDQLAALDSRNVG